MTRIKIIPALVCLACLTACGNGDARLSGHFVGADSRPVYLERVMPGAPAPRIDTVTTNQKGEFSFRIPLPDDQPAIFNLRYDGGMVPLLISPRERVNVLSLGDIAGYRVSGSPESELVWRLHRILSDGAATLDSLSRLYDRTIPGGEHQESLRKAWVDGYLSVKRQHIAFIIENSSSLAAVYALRQRLPGDDVLFGGDNDVIYYRMVADSVRVRYPDSRYLRALDREVASMTAGRDLQSRLITEGVPELDHPEIELPDMYGQKVKLSSLAGKVVVLDFWSAADTGGRINNAEMKELWAAHADRGFAVYQVSVDTDKMLWINAVQEQKLPWTTVCDFRGQATSAVRSYNVTAVPCNFIIDRAGNIVGRNLYGDALERRIKELI